MRVRLTDHTCYADYLFGVFSLRGLPRGVRPGEHPPPTPAICPRPHCGSFSASLQGLRVAAPLPSRLSAHQGARPGAFGAVLTRPGNSARSLCASRRLHVDFPISRPYGGPACVSFAR